uniref:Temporin-1Cb n=1 Tax=Lithobates clamitans TaxID=145282 RepID=TP1B_LITCL|nr:RecName: Full=Temporin-1Cb [Lithobates clamitans]
FLPLFASLIGKLL